MIIASHNRFDDYHSTDKKLVIYKSIKKIIIIIILMAYI